MRLLLPLALVALAATPAVADPAADYARLRDALPDLDPARDAVGYVSAAQGVVQAMQGRWLMTSPALLSGQKGLPPPGQLQDLCERAGMQATPDGPLGFTLSTPTRGQPFTLRMTWAGGSSFLATMDFAGAMDRFFPGMKVEDTPGGALLQMAQSGQGHVALLPAGQDLMLMVPTSQPVQLLLRCP